MALNGIEVKVKIHESIIQGLAESFIENLSYDHTEEAMSRVGDTDAIIRKLQADADFRKHVELHVQETLQTITNEDLYEHDVHDGVFDDLNSDEDHWIAQYQSDLVAAEEQLETENNLQQEVEREQSLVDALALLEQRGIKVVQQDNELAEAMRIAQAAGYKVEA